MNNSSKSKTWTLQASAAIAVAIVSGGCGGGGGTNGGIAAGGAGGNAAVSYSAGAGLLSPTQRQAAITAVSTSLSAVPINPNGLQNPLAIVAALKSIKGVLNVQAQPNGSVTAQFSDGLPFTIFNDRAASTATRTAEAPVRSADTMAQTRTVPAGGNVSFQNALNSSYNTLNSSKATTAFASTHDYMPPIVGTATVAELRALGSTYLGVLYLAAHGGNVIYTASPPNGTETNLGYGISTSTPWSTATASEYQADYAAHSLGLGFADNAWCYCIMPKFISEYKWSFSKDSLVVLDTCSSGKLDENDTGTFRAALFTAGASVVAEWPTTEAYGGNATGFLIDRMLGTNTILPITNPPTRPLSLTDSLTLLKTFSSLNGDPVDVPTTYLNPATSGQQFTTLVPTISSATVTGTTLTLTGEFGIPGGSNTTVTIGSSPTTTVDVTSTGLTCTIPVSATGSTPAFASASVYAKVSTQDGRTLKSNTVTVDASLVPLEQGRTWTDSCTLGSGSTGTVTFTSKGPATPPWPGGASAILVAASSDSSYWYNSTSQGLLEPGEAHYSEAGPLQAYAPALILIPSTTTAGYTWTQKTVLTFYKTNGSIYYVEDLTLSGKVVGVESVTVTAGTFNNALHIHIGAVQTNGTYTSENDQWYVAGIGLIKSTNPQATSDLTTKLSLDSFTR